MLLVLTSCEDSSSIEELNQSKHERAFVTFEGPDGEIVQKEVPEELQQANEAAQSRMMCEATITNTSGHFWHGVSVNGKNVLAFAGVPETVTCSCSGYIWLVTSAPGRTITWDVPGAGGYVKSGVLPQSNGIPYIFY